MRLMIVIVNYCTAKLVEDCLRSLEPELAANPEIKVVIADNCSPDGSAAVVAECIARRGWGGWAALVPLERNGGFAYGNNAAIRPALAGGNPPEYFMMLNPDTLVLAGAIKALIDFMERHPEAGIAGSRLEEPDGTPQISAFRFPSILSEFDSGLRLGFISRLLRRWAAAPPVPREEVRVDWMAGAAMIIRKEVFDSIGLLDEGYFMYCEEVDFCLKAQRAGWPSWYVPSSHVVHLVGQSSGVTDTKRPPQRLPRYWFESRRRFFRRNRGVTISILADIAWTLGFAIFRVRRLVQRKPDTDPPYLLSDFIRFNFLKLK